MYTLQSERAKSSNQIVRVILMAGLAIGILTAIVVIGIYAWKIVPQSFAKTEERQACTAVVDEMRRHTKTPATAIFPSCDSIVTTPGESGGYFISSESGGYTIMGEFEIPRPGFTNPYRYMFTGDAWRSSEGWEVKITGTLRLLP